MRRRSLREAYGRKLVELGHRRPDVVVLDADLSSSTHTFLFAREFPHRFFNVGVSEQDMMGMAAGLASAGKTVFVSTFAVFAAGRAWEQVRYSIAYNRLRVRIVATHGGVTVGEDGASHQCTEDLALMRVLPNLSVIVPADAVETEAALESIVDHPGPIYMRLSRMEFPVIFEEGYRFRLGRGVVVREGRDVVAFCCGLMVYQALEAARLLGREGIELEVVNLSTLKPLDEELVVERARRCGAAISVEEHSVIGGLGSAVAECLAERCPVPLRRVGVRDEFGASGSAEELLLRHGLTPAHIAQAAREVLEVKGRKPC